MSTRIIEILTVNLPQEMKPYRMEDRFVAYTNPEQPGVPTSYSEAVREAIALGPQGSVGFVTQEPAPATKPNYREALPEIMSRTKRGGRK